jgi:colanic acid biosynthesis glycosyl transferase WcaI
LSFLFVNQHYPPDPAPTGTLLAELARALAARGHSIRVLTGRPTYEEARRTRVPREEIQGGVHVVRLPILPRARGAAGRFAHYVSFALALVVAGLRGPRPRAILAFSSTPLVGGLASLALARLRGVPWIYVVQDVYPEVAVALGVLRPRGIATRIAAWIESASWRGASRVVLIGKDLVDVARARGVRPERITVIENWVDVSRIRPRAESELRREAHIEDDAFVVQYAGNLGRSQDLDTVLAAADLVERTLAADAAIGAGGVESEARRRAPRVRFLLVGSGARAAEMRGRAERLEHLRVLPFQPEDRLADVLAAADLALVPLRSGLTRFSVPSKVYSILASGRAIGAAIDAGSEVARIVDEAECGFRVDPGDAEGLAAEILRLAKDPPRAARWGSNARHWVERHGTLERAATAYESILTEVAG